MFAISLLATSTILVTSLFNDDWNLITIISRSYKQFSSAYFINATYSAADERINHTPSILSSYTGGETVAEHKMNDVHQINSIILGNKNQVNITMNPYIKIHKFWNKDPVDVLIDINPHTIKRSTKYIIDIQKAIWTWSNLLKIYSRNYNSWDFQIKNDSFNSPPESSIIIKVSSDPLGQICNDTNGSRFLALTVSPQRHDTNAYIDIPTSCLIHGREHEMSHQEIYSTTLHEFGHALGLGHAYNNDGDLMCGTQGHNGVAIGTCKQYSIQSTIPSVFDLKALFYIYGTDGFSEPNNKLIGTRIKQYNSTG